MTIKVASTDRYTLDRGQVFLTGVQALVRCSLDHVRSERGAGRQQGMLVTGYPGSPLAGLDLELGRQRPLLDELAIHHQPALNEELAATAVLGSQLAHLRPGFHHDGVSALWYGKAPGLDRALDAVRHGNVIGVAPGGGAVLAVGDDALSKSSTLPSSSETTFQAACIPFLAPTDPQEVLDLGLHAFALSRASGLWAGIKIATSVADGFTRVAVSPDRIRPRLPTPTLDGEPYRHAPSARLFGPQLLEMERTLHEARLVAAADYATLNGLNRTEYAGADDEIGIVASGSTYLDVLHALDRLGLPAGALASSPLRLFRVGMPFPVDARTIRDFGRGLRHVVVVEEKRAFLEIAVKDALYGTQQPPAVSGKRHHGGAGLVPVDGSLDADRIAALLRPLLPGTQPPVERPQSRMLPLAPATPAAVSEPAALPPRTPLFCSGCPHNLSTVAPAGATVGGGIGCHAMALLMPPERVGDVIGLTQMGGEGAQWIGIAPFVDTDHFIQNLGDGTFLHSGSLGIRAAVAAGVNITFKLLHNSAVAMTGGQDAVGRFDVPRLTHLLAAEGVRRIIVTTDAPGRFRRRELAPGTQVWDRRRLLEAQQVLQNEPGVTVLVHDQECTAELRRKRKRGAAPQPAARVLINERVCEGCGDCVRASNCISLRPVDTEYGRKTRIDQTSCNLDTSCVDGDCPAFITVTPKPSRTKDVPRSTTEPLPEPAAPTSGPVNIRLVGVGGTGVVTLAQIIGAAAVVDGKHVHGMDQTGLAQKGGPVVSDLRIGAEPVGTNKIAAGECDLYVACDLITAAEPRFLEVVAPERTTAVLATGLVPTGHMLRDPRLVPAKPDGLVDRISQATDRSRLRSVDVTAVSEQRFGTGQFANTLLLGIAYQLGALPIARASIEAAIRANGAAVETNLEAFQHGRRKALPTEQDVPARTVACPDDQPAPDVDRARQLVAGIDVADAAVRDLIIRRAADLIGYQSARYAARYVHVVGRVVDAERARVTSGELGTVVAQQLHRVMAYKDEYEVARLHLDPASGRQVEATFGAGARVAWNLHPPVLRALGLRRKLRVGRWFAVVYRLLRASRHLRGTPLDPFGYARVRRAEPRLVTEYVALVDELLDGLTEQTHVRAVQLASLVDVVRGYEEVKMRNLEAYHRDLAAARRDAAAPV